MNRHQHHAILYDIYCLMLLIVYLAVCGVAVPGRQCRELPGFPGLNFEAAALPLTLSRPMVASASSLFSP